MESPAKYLKCVGFSTTQDSDGTIAQYVFDDGSIWQQHVGGGWECIWKPEPVAVIWADLPAQNADTFGMTFESLRRTDGKLEITPATSGSYIRSAADILRIKELDAEVAAWKAAASTELVSGSDEPTPKVETPEALTQRLKELFAWATRADRNAVSVAAESESLKKVLRTVANTIADHPPF